MHSVRGDLYFFVPVEDCRVTVHPTVATNIGMDIRSLHGEDMAGKNLGAEAVTVD